MANLSIESQLKAIEKKLKSKIQDALLHEVTDTVKETMLGHIKRDVYDQYSPVDSEIGYKRRLTTDGLADEGNIDAKIKGNTLIVENNTMSNEDYLPDGKKPYKIAGVIEYGNGEYGVYDYKNIGDRPFIENTREDLRESGEHIDALKRGLKRQNIDVK